MAMSTETVPGTGRPAGELDASIDELAVNTIRTLAMDAVQAANSGHPGTPMAMAPVAYTLWQQFLRFDPGRSDLARTATASCSRSGHASMLLYSLLHLAGVKAVNPEYERLGELSVTLDDIKRFRQLDSSCPGHPGVPLDVGRRDHDRPARPGRGDQRRHGDRRRAGWPRTSTGPASSCSTTTSTRSCGDGDMMEGISREAASLAGHLRLVEPLLDLRQQPHHDRGQHRPRVHRGRRHALHRLRLERHARRRRQRPRDARAAPSRRSRATTDRPTLIIVDSHIGYGAPNKQDTQRRPRRAARRGGDQAHQAGLRLAGGRASSSSPTACASTSRDGIGARGADAARRRGWRMFERYQAEHPDLADAARSACSAASCPTAGTRTSRRSRPTRRAWPAATSSGKVLNAIAQERARG